jgi:hypothetical protein
MQPLCNLLAVAVSDHQSRDIPPSRPSPDPPPRAKGGQGRTPSRHALSCLPGKSKHYGIHFVVGATFHVSSE